MPDQIPDALYFENKQYLLYSEPLAPYLEKSPEFQAALTRNICSTDCSRGYIGYWSIERGYLCLLDVIGTEGSTIFQELFPHATAPLIAQWYSGPLDLYVNSEGLLNELGRPFELPVVIVIEKGVVIETIRETGADHVQCADGYFSNSSDVSKSQQIEVIEGPNVRAKPSPSAPILKSLVGFLGGVCFLLAAFTQPLGSGRSAVGFFLGLAISICFFFSPFSTAVGFLMYAMMIVMMFGPVFLFAAVGYGIAGAFGGIVGTCAGGVLGYKLVNSALLDLLMRPFSVLAEQDER